MPHSILAHELGGMKQVLDGPVTAIFKDATADSLHAYLLPKCVFPAASPCQPLHCAWHCAWHARAPGIDRRSVLCLSRGFKHITDYDLDDVRPLVEAMINGRRKAFLYPSAGFFLQVPEMSMPLDRVSVPSSSLNDAFLEVRGPGLQKTYFFARRLREFCHLCPQRERDSPCPCVLVVDAESIRDDAAEDLDELGAFSMEREGLRIVRENHRHHPGSDHIEDHAVVAQA